MPRNRRREVSSAEESVPLRSPGETTQVRLLRAACGEVHRVQRQVSRVRVQPLRVQPECNNQGARTKRLAPKGMGEQRDSEAPSPRAPRCEGKPETARRGGGGGEKGGGIKESGQKRWGGGSTLRLAVPRRMM